MNAFKPLMLPPAQTQNLFYFSRLNATGLNQLKAWNYVLVIRSTEVKDLLKKFGSL